MQRIRMLPVSKAKREIEYYIKHKKQKVWIEDILNDLNIDLVTVIKATKQLEKEGKIKSDGQRKRRSNSRR